MQHYCGFRWCSKYLILKIFFVSVLLQYCLSFDSSEEEILPNESSYYQNLENGMWKVLRKIPRGYMVPIPRVGKRHIHLAKRQNMIPQPRIGRQLDINDELAEILYEIQNYFLQSNLLPVHPGTKLTEKLPSESLKHLIGNNVKNTGDGNTDAHQKSSDISEKDKNDISQLLDQDSASIEHEIGDNKIDIPYFPNKEERFSSKEDINSGIQMYDGEKGFIPLSHIGRTKLPSTLDENLARGLLAYPRLGRRLWEQTKTLIPYPRAGRLVIDPEDYDIFLNVDASSDSEDLFSDVLKSNPTVVKKGGQVKLIPRVGRKKRSISNDETENNLHSEEEKKVNSEFVDDSNFDSFDDSQEDYIFPNDKRGGLSKSAFAPRIGKKESNYLDEYLEDKRAAAFTPRIGRGAMFTPRIGRAAQFTPRIGRAALIPRIGRTDPRLRLRSRSSFIPRIGRRATLVPRIGRSENS